MSEPKPPKTVLPYIAALTVDPNLMESVWAKLQGGRPEIVSPPIPFTWTDYYAPEMGPQLWRVLASLPMVPDPAQLVDLKLTCHQIEREAATQGLSHYPRPINLDPGYLDLGKVVLASFKDYTHRIYLGRGVYAEVVLGYQAGGFYPMTWTYPDYRSVEYLRFFTDVRKSLHSLLSTQDKEMGHKPSPGTRT